MKKIKKESQVQYQLWDCVIVTKGFFEGMEGFLVNIDYDAGSFEIQPAEDGSVTNGSEQPYYVYADEIMRIDQGALVDDDDDDEDEDDESFYDGVEDEE